MEIALGNDYANSDLLIFHASIGHDFKEMVTQAKEMAPNAQIVAASCCGVVGREGVS
jgi:Ni,Fe-hydrogenase III small subunit